MATSGYASQVKNSRDTFGGHFWTAVDYHASNSYNNTGTPATSGDLLDPHAFGFPNTITAVHGSLDETGVYVAIPLPVSTSTTAWRLLIFTASGMTQVANATDIHTIVFRLSAIGY